MSGSDLYQFTIGYTRKTYTNSLKRRSTFSFYFSTTAGRNFTNRRMASIINASAAAGRCCYFFTNRQFNFSTTAGIGFTHVGRQVVTVEMSSATRLDIQVLDAAL